MFGAAYKTHKSLCDNITLFGVTRECELLLYDTCVYIYITLCCILYALSFHLIGNEMSDACARAFLFPTDNFH